MLYNIKDSDVEILESCMLCESTNLVEISNVCDDNGVVFLETSCCEDCGFVFRNKRPKLEWFLNAWAIRTNDDTATVAKLTTNTELEKMRYERYTNLAIVLEDCVANKNILDVGCGPATGLRAFNDRGWDVTGVEPDPLRAKIGVEQHKLNIHNCTIENFSNSRQYDMVTLIHSLEHIHDPKSFLRSVIDKITDGGFLYVEVPDLFSSFVDIRDSLYLEHISNFSKSTLQTIGKDLGLSVKKTFVTKTSPTGYNHIAALFQKDIEKQWQDNEININDESYGVYVNKDCQENSSSSSWWRPQYVENIKKIYRTAVAQPLICYGICMLNIADSEHTLPMDLKLNFQVSGIENITNTCKFGALEMKGAKLKMKSEQDTVNLLAGILGAIYPDALVSFAEENYFRGYRQGLENAHRAINKNNSKTPLRFFAEDDNI